MKNQLALSLSASDAQNTSRHQQSNRSQEVKRVTVSFGGFF